MRARGFPALWLVAAWSLFGATVRAQSGTSESDSLRSYELSEIVVDSDSQEQEPAPSVRRITLASIARQDGYSTADLVRLIPSAHLQTNSRGESLVYVRNAGERQVSVFFDGALLNIPWDNRIDLSLLPNGMLGGIEVSRGVPSVMYGTNVIGGAVNLLSRSLGRNGGLTDLAIQTGSESSVLASGSHLYRKGEWSGQISGGYQRSDGYTLPGSADLPFNQIGTSRRTNTDRRIGDLFVRIGRETKNHGRYGISILHVSAKKGVAPEGHLDPGIDRVRFWRYPEWRNTMAIANLSSGISRLGVLRASVWVGNFRQRIDQYGSSSYRRIAASEQDEDFTAGARLINEVHTGYGTLRTAVNVLISRHRQTDSVAGSTERLQEGPELNYRQNIYSAGVEYERGLGPATGLSAGFSLDGVAMPETGDKPARKGLSDYNLTLGLEHELGRSSRVRFSAGRRVRFPTMRELFGEALNRFQLNTELSPESSWMAESSIEYSSATVYWDAGLFFRRTFDTIDQENVRVEGRRLRRRINLDGSRVWGAEVNTLVNLTDRVSLTGSFTWSVPRALKNGSTTYLNEKPDVLGSFSVHATTGWGGALTTDVRYTGHARALSPDDRQVLLPTALILNVRTSYRYYIPRRGVFVEFYSRIQNLLDRVELSQQGLPGAGRDLRAGLSLAF